MQEGRSSRRRKRSGRPSLGSWENTARRHHIFLLHFTGRLSANHPQQPRAGLHVINGNTSSRKDDLPSIIKRRPRDENLPTLGGQVLKRHQEHSLRTKAQERPNFHEPHLRFEESKPQTRGSDMGTGSSMKLPLAMTSTPPSPPPDLASAQPSLGSCALRHPPMAVHT